MSIPETLAKMYKTMQIYNAAEEIAKKVFHDVIDDPTRISKKFKVNYDKQTDPLIQLSLGCAYNVAFIGAMLRAGDEGNTTKIVQELVKHDQMISMFDQYLRDFETSYLGMTIKMGKFPVPAEVTQHLIDDHTDYGGDPTDLFAGDALVVATPHQDSQTKVSGTFKKINSSLIHQPGIPLIILHTVSQMAGFSLLYEGSPDKIHEQILPKIVEDHDLKDPKLLIASHEGMHPYVGLMGLIETIGIEMKDNMQSLDLDHMVRSIT